MASSARGYRCPRCGDVVILPTERERSFSCMRCRTAVVLIDQVYCFHGSLDGTEAPTRCAIEHVRSA